MKGLLHKVRMVDDEWSSIVHPMILEATARFGA